MTQTNSICSPEGKKFRSRNELRAFFLQTRSTLNSEDFDFSVKGKGHATKGKSPTKKADTESSSKENNRSSSRARTASAKKTTVEATPPVSSASNRRRTPTNKTASARRRTSSNNTTATPAAGANDGRPKRDLRKRQFSNEPEEEEEESFVSPPKSPVLDDEELTEEDMKDEISNVKLKVKVGYTATGAMIRPSAGNGTRKKKRRFMNMKVKKNVSTTSQLSGNSQNSKRISPVAADALAIQLEEQKCLAASKKKPAPTTSRNGRKKRKVKGKPAEPVAGPSGLQKHKRPPRRVLKRVGAGGVPESDDDEDEMDYYHQLYAAKSEPSSGASADDGSVNVKADDVQRSNGDVNGGPDQPAHLPPQHLRPKAGLDSSNAPNHAAVNGAASAAESLSNTPSATEVDSEVGPMIAMEPSTHIADVEGDTASVGGCDDGSTMQVVVIGDSVEALHNYAKPHAV